MLTRLRWTALTLAMVILVAACGGSTTDPADDPTTTTAGASVSTTTAAPSATTPPATTPGAGDGSSQAVVTIEGVEYRFEDSGAGSTCDSDFFGGFFAVLRTADLASVFSVELWNPGTGDGKQIPSATMNVIHNGEELDLEADPETAWPAADAGTSFVGPFSYEGNTAQGTITFINTEVAWNADLKPLAPIEATFTVTCASG